MLKELIKDAALFLADKAQESVTGFTMDWSQGVVLFKGSNIAWNLASYTREVSPGIVYVYDKNGVKRADGTLNDPYVDEYNKQLREMNEADWRALDEEVSRLFPELERVKPWDVLPNTNTCFRDARAWRQPVDPLMLDLDGDGLELKRASASILFDHNADTIKTGTGWIGSDDGILVRDLNGNGSIDSGRELFGIDTLKRDGKNALNGFDALADLDSNADGQFNAADLAWNSVQVWRDLDQDGVSERGELFGLDALGISRIGVVGSTINTTGGTQAGTTVNASLIAQSASFTRQVDGVQVNRTVGAVDLESNPFYREFTMAVPLTEQAKALPQMQGSGRARDLAEAVSLSPSRKQLRELG